MGKIGYSEFCQNYLNEGESLDSFFLPGFKLKPDGIWVEPPPDDALLTPSERAELAKHPAKDLTKPALAFPCTEKQLYEFFEFYGLPDGKPQKNGLLGRPESPYKEKVRAAAKLVWEREPSITIADMCVEDEITNACDGEILSTDTLRKWIKDLCPNRNPGRRPRKK